VTVITHVVRRERSILVRGTTADNSKIKYVKVNGQDAVSTRDGFAEWEATLAVSAGTTLKLAAYAEDVIGNVESRPHRLEVK
jgi:hypothetical protein